MKFVPLVTKRKSVAALLMTVGVAIAVFVIACGGTETVEVTRVVKETVIVEVEKVVEVEKEVEVEVEKEVEVEVVVTATSGPSDTMMMPTEQSGTLVAALQDVGLPVGTPALCVPTCSNEQYYYSVWDTPVQWSADGRVIPAVAESWELASDYKSFTWHIRPGIQFHKGWGEVDAEDFAWSTNTVNPNVNPETLHDVGGDLACCYGETVAVDRYTAVMEIIKYDSRLPGWLFSNLRDAYSINSKKIYDELGPEGMRDVFVGTGPFEIREWLDNDKNPPRCSPRALQPGRTHRIGPDNRGP